nr:PREDICTED: zinc finger protein 558 isoform X9 [Tribolium castaneum]|eukprot:XP_015834123.1 PREDICTED: zinc finger protein 558 isoform X9 [Tribolium castaneum]
MGSIENISELCRLCLVKDQVNVPIFEENATKEQTFVKINSCLPVKVSRDDSLPKKICDGCSCKLDMLYTFRNTSVDSEKQLLKWLNQAGLSCSQSAVKDPLASTKPEVTIKQETFEPTDSRDDLGLDTHSYIMQQQKLPYSQEFEFGEPSESNVGLMTDEPAPKKAKRAAALNKASVETDEDDLDAAMQITKAEDEDSDEIDQPEYVEAPSTSADDQPGPSGVNKTTVEAPSELNNTQETIILHIEDDDDQSNELVTVLEEEPTVKPLQVPKTKKRERVVCQECGILVTWNHLDTHMYEMHYYMPDVVSPKVLCAKCGVLCKDNRAYANHSRSHYHSCDQCLATFPSEEELETHKMHHVKKPYQCDQCKESFNDLWDFVVHKEGHEGSGKYSCPECSYVSCKISSMKRHLQHHEGRTVYQCDLCEKKILGSAKYKTHMEIHTGIKKYTCEYCPKKFQTANYLKIHRELNHHKELYGYDMTYPCRECGKVFKFEKSLKRHLSTIHKIGEDRTVSCPVCYKKIANSYNLKVHMRMHTGEKTNMCDSCGKAYHTYKSYKKHVLVHHPEMKPVPKTEPKSCGRKLKIN